MEKFLNDLGIKFRDEEFAVVIPKKLGITLKDACILEYGYEEKEVESYTIYTATVEYGYEGDWCHMDKEAWQDVKPHIIEDILYLLERKLLGE